MSERFQESIESVMAKVNESRESEILREYEQQQVKIKEYLDQSKQREEVGFTEKEREREREREREEMRRKKKKTTANGVHVSQNQKYLFGYCS